MKVYLVFRGSAIFDDSDELMAVFSNKISATKYMSESIDLYGEDYIYFLEEWTVKE